MAVKQIKLEVQNEKGETITYKSGFIPGRKVREALKVGSMAEKEDADQIEVLDTMILFVADLFEGLTDDMILDGIASWELMSELQRVLTEVLGGDTKA